MQGRIYELAQEIFTATAARMGRKPLGGSGEKTVMVPMRWAPATLARMDSARGDADRSAFIREAVEEALAKREKP